MMLSFDLKRRFILSIDALFLFYPPPYDCDFENLFFNTFLYILMSDFENKFSNAIGECIL